jgi:cob(I)alamin adenosyltransferase
MVQLTRIYTRGGDKGKTSLGSGKRVLKTDPRIMAIGEVDELNSTLGVCHLSLPEEHQSLFHRLQNDLFDVGADLCMDDLTQEGVLRIQPSQVIWLEETIDHFNKDLSPLRSFVLPGGSVLSASLHVSRAVARRAERALIALQIDTAINQQVIVYLNRLSDLLFVLARFFNDQGKGDILWQPGESQGGR